MKRIYLVTVTTLFFFTDYTHYAVLLHCYKSEVSDYAHCAVFLHLLHPLCCFTSLLLSVTSLITLFYFTIIKMKYLTTLTTLFFFIDYTTALFYLTVIKMKYLTTLTRLFFFTDYTQYDVLLHYY